MKRLMLEQRRSEGQRHDDWKPYLGLGLHYLRTIGFDSRGDAEVTGGVAYQFSPRFSLRLDEKLLLRNGPGYDHRDRMLIGFGWRF